MGETNDINYSQVFFTSMAASFGWMSAEILLFIVIIFLAGVFIGGCFLFKYIKETEKKHSKEKAQLLYITSYILMAISGLLILFLMGPYILQGIGRGIGILVVDLFGYFIKQIIK